MWIPIGRGVVGTVGRGPVAIHSSGQIILSLTHIEGITLGAGEEVDEVAGGASGMSVHIYLTHVRSV